MSWYPKVSFYDRSPTRQKRRRRRRTRIRWGGSDAARTIGLEPLEPRLLLSATAVLTDGVLELVGDGNANTFVITQTSESESGAALSVLVDGTPHTFIDVTQVGLVDRLERVLSGLATHTRVM